MSEFCSRGPVWSNGTVPEGTLLGRATGGNVAALTAAQAFTVIGLDKGSAVARFIARARSGEALKITCVGDSILEGHTVTNVATDGAMILLAADLSARFSATVTQTNHAVSGSTAATAHINGYVADAIAEAADLYIVSAFDKNDLGSDISGTYAPGYPLAASAASVERIIRAIRTSVPKADVVVMSTNPYVSTSAYANAYQVAKDAAIRRVAAVYGCEWVDCYSAFVALGDFSALLADSTHPNTAGHRLIADTILSHFPDRDIPTSHQGAVASLGLYSPQNVDVASGGLGYVYNATPGASASVTYVTGGTGWVSEATSTAGDYVEASASALELLVQISTAAVDACVVDVAVDGVTVQSALNLPEVGGKLGTYWVPFVTGLSSGANHTLRLTLVSGTLRTFATAALLSVPAWSGNVRTQIVHATVATTTMTTSYQTIGAATSVPLPSGWGSMDLVVSTSVAGRTPGATTANRRLDISVRNSGTAIQNTRQSMVAQASALSYFDRVSQGMLRGLTSAASIDVIAKVDDATDTIQTLSVYTNVTLIRAS